MENCMACGVQRTLEVNEFLIEDFKQNIADGVQYRFHNKTVQFKYKHDNWGYFSFGNDAFCRNYCLSCMVIQNDMMIFLDIQI